MDSVLFPKINMHVGGRVLGLGAERSSMGAGVVGGSVCSRNMVRSGVSRLDVFKVSLVFFVFGS